MQAQVSSLTKISKPLKISAYSIVCLRKPALRRLSTLKCLTIAAVRGERYTQFFAIITIKLEVVRAPPLVTFPDGHCLYAPVSRAVLRVYAQSAMRSDA